MCGSWLARAAAHGSRAALVAACAFALACGGNARSRAGDDAGAGPTDDGGTVPLDGSARDGGGGRMDAGDAGSARPPDRPRRPPGTVIVEPDDPATYIYDQAELRTYELRLSPEALATIDADPQAEEYVPGTLLFEEREYGPVGIRYKGSIGAFRGCVNALIGTKACTKLSMKVSFNWQDPEGRFYGLRKLQFHAMNRDPSMLKERLGYAMMRESGLAAPRAVHARLRVNGELLGLFALVEEIDGRFTRSRFSEGGEGNLYKEAWPLTANNGAVTDANLRMTLTTNEDDRPALDTMLAFGRALEHSSADGLSDALAAWLDVDYVMRYVAVDRTIAHDDGPFHFYCGGRACSNHNYYWYEEAASDRLWLIGWDLDSSFNLDNTTTTVWMSWEDSTLGCGPVSQEPYLIPQRAPLCDKLIFAWAQQQQRYLDAVQTFLDGPFEPAAVEAKLSTWEAQIAPVVEQASALHADAPKPDAWRVSAAALRSAIEQLRDRARARVALGAIAPDNPWNPQRPADAGAMDAATPDATTPDATTMDAGTAPPPPDASPAPDACSDSGDDDAGRDLGCGAGLH